VQSRSPDWPGRAVVAGRRRRAPPMIMNTNIHERVEYHLDTTVYTNINIYVYIYIYTTYVHMYTSESMNTLCVRVYTYTHVYKYMYMCAYIC